MTGRGGLLTPRRLWLAAVVLLGVAAALAMSRPSGSIAEDGPQGTLALQRFLGELGADGSGSATPPARGTFVLLADVRSPEDVDELLAWAGQGNRLVVTSSTATAQRLDVQPTGRVGGSVLGTTPVSGTCPMLDGVGDVSVRVTDRRLEGPIDQPSCLGSPPYLLELAHGAGEVIVLGGRSPLTNELLDQADNAAFAVRVLRGARDGPVRFGPPLPPSSTGRGLWATLPPSGRAALVGLAVAAFLLALARGRRLGPPPVEAVPSPLPQRELVDATARLLQASGDHGYIVAVLQRTTEDRLRHRLGLPPGIETPTVARVAADATGLDAATIERHLRDRTPRGPEETARLARDLEALVQATTTAQPTTAQPTDDRQTL
ncbi:MAG TPA: DUF4350 domain-containing protein [Nitriliruptorales bacterium]